MASIYESAQQNFLNAQSNASFGRVTQSQHDAARRYVEANNMDYDSKKGYGAKGSFDTQKVPKVKTRDPRKGEFRGGAAGFAGIASALGLDKMSPSEGQAEMSRRFGGGPDKFADGTPNPYKRYDNQSEAMRQMQIRRYEKSKGITSKITPLGSGASFKTYGTLTAPPATPLVQNLSTQPPMGSTAAQNFSKPLSMIEMNRLSSQGLLENALFGTPVRPKSNSSGSRISTSSISRPSQPTQNNSYFNPTPIGYNNQPRNNKPLDLGLPSFGGITI